MKSKQLIFAFVFLLLGFLLTFSYQHTKSTAEIVQVNDQEWERDYYYRKQLIDMEEKNKQLRDELNKIRQEVQETEQELANGAADLKDLVETKANLQKLTGELPIVGDGVAITLSDASYIPSEDHANQYIVHDRHIHKTVNELYSAGAKAIAINGQRIYRNSYISCVGPVVSVDGSVHPAPFVISAIGDQEILEVSLNLKNGVIDMLVQDNIEVTVEKETNIEMFAKDM
ncbi:DUF881 domain-containing protein [Gracilibacillus kekensis]|uniref:Uncharacterized conserved protein YlxW, UPF0749 family n=1 Tax=Gracilibacillus kekensis TaxID=1027249 RepID=A0A1M7PDM5_9BACI|nr:DUF881 domain-containing protein [Gracilibacillus kekensis]SHN15055.1 Uncharacterized conserved protein YlxW, UPF0749 family [Gracilibacillus kekensis]